MFTWKRPLRNKSALRASAKLFNACEVLEPRRLLTATPNWLQTDIGSGGGAGASTPNGSSLTTTGYGNGLNADNDSGHFTYVPLTGDGEIDAEVTGFNSGTSYGQVDLSIRSSLAPSAANVAVEWTGLNTVQYEHRLSTSQWANNSTPYGSTNLSIWLRLVREGQQISAYQSTDGSTWISAGYDTVDLGTSAYIGVFVGGGAYGSAATATLTNVTVGAINQPFATSWVGNTLGGGDAFVQDEVDALFVAPDGTLYTDSSYDEGGHEAGIYKNGQEAGYLQDTHTWGRVGGSAVTSDGTYIYLAMEQEYVPGANGDYPSAGTNWYCVRRYNLDGSPAPFAGGRGWDGSMLLVDTAGPVTGLATYQGTLYVSDSGQGLLHAYSTSNMGQTAVWPLAAPGAITVDGQGTLWVVQNANGTQAACVVQFGSNLSPMSGEIDRATDPVALATNNLGQVMVTDDGPAKQVLTYAVTTTTPQLVSTFGTYGGLASGTPGVVTPTKFDGLAGVGMDAAGNLYVSTSSTGTTIRSFSPTGTQNWELDGLEFISVADVDPATDGNDVYTMDHHYVMDYTQPAGQQATLYSTTLDGTDYPEDPRLFSTMGLSTVLIRRINGVKFMYVTDQLASITVVYRFNGEIAVPAAMFARGPVAGIPNSPATGAWLWVDQNGDGSFQASEFQSLGAADGSQWGFSVDSSGTVWLGSSSNGISKFAAAGIDANGVPEYSAATRATFAVPAPITELTRAIYDPSTDSMYLGGYTAANPHSGGEWGELGTTLIRYNNWSTTPTLALTIVLPYAPNASPQVNVKAISVAGGRLFAGISRTGQIYEYDTTTGALLTVVYPGPEVAGQTGWLDTANAVNAFQRANGEFLVFAEEVVQSKVIEYEQQQAAPTGLTATASSTSITLSWAAAAGATSYDLQRSTDGINFTSIAAPAGTATTYTDTGLQTLTSYYYRLRALGAYASSAPTAIAQTQIVPAVATVPVVTSTIPVTSSVYLSSLAVLSATPYWGPLTTPASLTASAGTITELGFTGTVTTATSTASSDIAYQLSHQYSRFTSQIQVDAGSTSLGTVVFEVLSDGRAVYISQAMSSYSAPATISIPVSGVTKLDLVVLSGGDGSAFDHADWVNAAVVLSGVPLVPSTTVSTVVSQPTAIPIAAIAAPVIPTVSVPVVATVAVPVVATVAVPVVATVAIPVMPTALPPIIAKPPAVALSPAITVASKAPALTKVLPVITIRKVVQPTRAIKKSLKKV